MLILAVLCKERSSRRSDIPVAGGVFISQASGEQVQGIDVVSDAAGRLDRMVVQNAAMVQQSAAATRQLHERVLRLDAAMGAYRGARAAM